MARARLFVAAALALPRCSAILDEGPQLVADDTEALVLGANPVLLRTFAVPASLGDGIAEPLRLIPDHPAEVPLGLRQRRHGHELWDIYNFEG